ncbi:fimbria/pilus outer membrane usher protein [Dyella sp. EPa41]|uniref:fimbria/pilus outer membrane usher protein n=1 Tax=Dyella sp. EPa41 TaxID=1561194 RepID=UPI0019157EB2|nr:fimbria/pilus outer membrane usher protein [Dyella sp. EPa41]
MRRKRIVGLILVALSPLPEWAFASTGPDASTATSSADADAVDFNTSFGGLGQAKVDISRFERANTVLPGTYRVDLFVNDIRLSRDDVSFRDVASRRTATACFSRAQLEKMGIAMDRIDPHASAGGECIDVAEVVPGAQVQFDAGAQRLDVSIPQASLNRQARGYVSPALWDRGATAATLGYSLSAYQSDPAHGASERGAFLGLNTGLNLGGWRLRDQTTATWSSHGDNHWQHIGTYAQHDVQRLRSQLTLGDSFTSGELFASTGFRGASLSTDDRMLPDSMTGYAPTVRGVAETRARVEIRQNDYLIYETTVAPGAFEINDLYATGYGGDLQVNVIEADGRVRSFSVPYAAVPRLLRPGMSRYAVTAGQVRNTASFGGSLPTFAEATYQRGLNNWLTGYAGAQATNSDLYRSALLGAAVNTPVGAFSLDVTGSWAKPRFQNDRFSGYSVRATYSKTIPSTDTNFALAAYRYSSRDYLDLADAASLHVRENDVATGTAPPGYRARDRFQLTLNQRLGQAGGALYASGSYYSYWNGQPKVTTYQLGYNNRFRSVNYSLTASRTYNGYGRTDVQYFLSFSMPLGFVGGSRPPMFSATAADGGAQGTSLRAGLSGMAGERNQVNYNLNASDSQHGSGSVDGSINWLTPYAVLGGSYTWSSQQRQATVNASGGIVVHAGGITFAQRMSETIGVLEAKGASGALLANGSQGRVDGRGYAVVSDLMPYRMNSVSLDPKGTSMDVELQSSRLQVAPRAGAVVPLKFETVTGRAVLIQARLANGEALPFGAQVLDAQGLEIGAVGQGGHVFARGGEEGGTLTVRWGEDGSQQCRLSYQLPARASNDRYSSFSTTEAQCR